MLSGPIFQVAWVVEDIAAAETWFTATLGVPRWTRIDDVEFGPETCSYRGDPADFAIHVSLGYAGPQQLELIQPVRGENIYTEHLERSGPGLHHFAYVPDDFDAVIAAAAERDLEIVQRGVLQGGEVEFAYLDGAAGGAGTIEVVRLSENMLRFFDSLAEAST